MMKRRTIEDVHDSKIGHKKFATFVDEFISNGYEITDIKEFQTKYKFLLSGYPMEFDKNPIVSVWWQYNQCKNLYEMVMKIREKQQ